MSAKKTSSTKSTKKPVQPSQASTMTATAPTFIASVITPIDPGVVTQCVDLLDQVNTLIGPVTALTPATIRQMLKLRKGGMQVVTDLLALCTNHGLTAVGPVTLATMSATMDRATALNQIGVQMSAVQKSLNDAAFVAESATWQSATTLYTVLQRLAVMDPTLAAGLSPIQGFFQTKKTKGTQRASAKAKKLKNALKLVAASAPAASAETPVSAPAAATINGANAATGALPAPSVTPPPASPNGAAHS